MTELSHPRIRTGVLLAVLLISLGPGRPVGRKAHAVEVNWRAALGIGYDDNIYREADSQMNEGRYLPYEGRYLPYEMKLELMQALPWSLLARAELGTRGGYYPSPNRDGARSLLQLRMNLQRRFHIGMPGGHRSRLNLSLLGVIGGKERTFYGRSAGEEYAVDLGDSVVALGDRYNSRFDRVGGELDWRLPLKIRFMSKIVMTRRDYREDYSEFSEIESIDYEAWRWNILLRKDFSKRWRMELEGARGRADYKEWSSRDFDGNQVLGKPQSFDYRTWQANIRYRPSDLGWIRLQFEKKIRRDPFLGYYDYDQIGFRPQLRLNLPLRTKVTLSYEYLHREYERARVGFNPVKDLREDFDRTLTLRTEHAWTGMLDLISQYSYRDTDEANPSYTYARSRIWIGIEAHH